MLRPIAEALIRGRDFRGKKRILRTLLKRLDGQPIRSRYGPILRLRARDFTNECCVIGMDHVDYDDVFREVSLLKPGMGFIDVGANAGLFSMVAGDRLGPSGAIVAFEPSLRVFRDLVDNAVMNGLTGFFPFNVAVGSTVTLARFASDEHQHSGGGHLDDQGAMTVLQASIANLAPLLDQVLGERSIVMKIDVEGAEELVVTSLLDWLKRARVEKIIAEIDPTYLARFGASAPGLYAKLKSVGFKPRRGLGDASHYNEVFERTVT